jgi:hypothetical protein
MVGQEDETLVRLGVAIADTPHLFRVVAGGAEVVERKSTPHCDRPERSRRAELECCLWCE